MKVWNHDREPFYFFPLFLSPDPPKDPFCEALAFSSFSAFSSSFFFWMLAMSTYKIQIQLYHKVITRSSSKMQQKWNHIPINSRNLNKTLLTKKTEMIEYVLQWSLKSSYPIRVSNLTKWMTDRLPLPTPKG